MSRSLSNLVKYLSERLRDKCKGRKSYLDYMSVKDDQLIFRCLQCKKHCKKYLIRELVIHKFCNGDINNFVLLLTLCVPWTYIRPFVPLPATAQCCRTHGRQRIIHQLDLILQGIMG